MYSADLIPIEQAGEPDKLDQWIEAHFSEEKAKDIIIGVAEDDFEKAMKAIYAQFK